MPLTPTSSAFNAFSRKMLREYNRRLIQAFITVNAMTVELTFHNPKNKRNKMKITLSIDGKQYWTTLAPACQVHLDFYCDTPGAHTPYATVERGSPLYLALAEKLASDAIAIAELSNRYLRQKKRSLTGRWGQSTDPSPHRRSTITHISAPALPPAPIRKRK